MNKVSITKILCVAGILFATTIVEGADNPYPEVNEEVKYYSISGSNTQELKSAMKQLGPVDKEDKHWNGYTDWHVDWSYSYVTTDQGCTTGPVKTKVDITMRLPQWDNPTENLRNEWQRYSNALRGHENGHKDIAIQAAQHIASELANLPPSSSCEELEKVADAEGNKMLDETRDQQKDYDATTNHGATQGARLK